MDETPIRELVQRIEHEITRNLRTVLGNGPKLPRNDQDAMDFVNQTLVPQGIRASKVSYDREARVVHITEWAISDPVEIINVKVKLDA